jgi:3-hydroxymyristoyl/3-hydroxydecanoyl-(acyl carrier protein) dehydratase
LVAPPRGTEPKRHTIATETLISHGFKRVHHRHGHCSAGSKVRFADNISVDPAGGTSRAVFFVDPSADYLEDHFPGAPTLPGLVMLESAVRAAAALWDATDSAPSGRSATLARVDRLQVVRRVVPGETLLVETTKEPGDAAGRTMKFTARGTVGGDPAMRARFSLRRFDDDDPR